MTATCSRAGSSGWTTSGSSIAPRRCPGVGRSSRPTARRGWRSTASGCCQIATELAKHDPAYADMALKFLTHFEWISIAMDRMRDAGGTVRSDQRGRLLSTTSCACPTAPRRRAQGALPRSACCRSAQLSTVFDDRRGRGDSPRSCGAPRSGCSTASPGCRGPRLARLPVTNPEPPGGTMFAALDEPPAAPRAPRGPARRGRVPRPARDPRGLPALDLRTALTSFECRAAPEYNGPITNRPSPPPECSAATPTGAARSGSR